MRLSCYAICSRCSSDRKLWLTPRRGRPNCLFQPNRHLTPLATHHLTGPLLLRRKSRLADVVAPQFDTQHPLHGAQHLLVRRRRTTLKVLDDRHGGVALGRKVLLRHLGLDLVSPLHDRLADLEADGLGFYDFIGAVDFGEVLAFYGRFLQSRTERSVKIVFV